MMAVATIIYMVVGTVRDAYFPSAEAPVARTETPAHPPLYPLTEDFDAASSLPVPASFILYKPSVRTEVATLTARPQRDCPSNAAVTPVLAHTKTPVANDTTIRVQQQPLPTPPPAEESSLYGLLVEGL